jgi:hypothetical protein
VVVEKVLPRRHFEKSAHENNLGLFLVTFSQEA